MKVPNLSCREGTKETESFRTKQNHLLSTLVDLVQILSNIALESASAMNTDKRRTRDTPGHLLCFRGHHALKVMEIFCLRLALFSLKTCHTSNTIFLYRAVNDT